MFHLVFNQWNSLARGVMDACAGEFYKRLSMFMEDGSNSGR